MKRKQVKSSVLRIGIVAPSSAVPAVEFRLGVDFLVANGFNVRVHPQCRKRRLFFAGSDEERAQAFFEVAQDPDLDVIWGARGGHGASRLLPLLREKTRQSGVPPKKLFVGFSDAVSLLEFVRMYWGWSALHAPMPSSGYFSYLKTHERRALFRWVRGERTPVPWSRRRLKFFHPCPPDGITAPLAGGNLTVLASLAGTSFSFDTKGKMLFFEDTGEDITRIDRMAQQLSQSGAFGGACAIVLGDFEGCEDSASLALTRFPPDEKRRDWLTQPLERNLAPIRRSFSQRRVLNEIFGEIGVAYGIPVAYGLPAGHGPGHCPVPLGATYTLTADGKLELRDWDWQNRQLGMRPEGEGES
jgi:muramoyltetrapeptide carboxypeptidase